MFSVGDFIQVRDDAAHIEGRVYGITLGKPYKVLDYKYDSYEGVVQFLDDQGDMRIRSPKYYRLCDPPQIIEQECHESETNKSTNENWGMF